MLVRVDEHAVRAAEPAAELVEPFPQHGVVVTPGVAGQRPFAGAGLRPIPEVAQRGRDDGARALEQ